MPDDAAVGRDLWTMLGDAGLDGPAAPTFGALWPAIVAWAEWPVLADVHPLGDSIELLWAWHEPEAQGGWTYFHPPEELGEPLFAVSIARSFRGHPRLTEAQHHAAAGVDLLLADTDRWDGLETISGYLGRGAAFPAVEHWGPASRLGELTGDEVVRLAWQAPLVGAIQGLDRVRTWR